LLKEKGYSLRNIANALGRSVSTISDELKRNKVWGTYDASKAQHKSYVRRQQSKYQGMHVVQSKETQQFVDESLFDDLSPEAIAGRLRTKGEKLVGVSKDSIYRYVKSVYGRKIEAYRKRKRRRRRRRTVIHASLQDRVFIDQRPEYINTRQRIGDAEGDLGEAAAAYCWWWLTGKSGRPFLNSLPR
jgi:transposase, IS30 family